MKTICTKFFRKANFKKLSKRKMSKICKKLAEKTGDDEMMKKVESHRVSKEEMIDYCKDEQNIQKISSARELEDYLEIDEFEEIDDFSEIREGTEEQMSEMCGCQPKPSKKGRSRGKSRGNDKDQDRNGGDRSKGKSRGNDMKRGNNRDQDSSRNGNGDKRQEKNRDSDDKGNGRDSDSSISNFGSMSSMSSSSSSNNRNQGSDQQSSMSSSSKSYTNKVTWSETIERKYNLDITKSTISYTELREAESNFFEKCRTDKLSDSETTAVCKKLAETIDDDEMLESISQSSVTKEDMIYYIRDIDNIQRIKTATEMTEFLQTDALQQIDDFPEFKSGCDSQLSEMSRDEDRSTIEKKKQKRSERQENNKKKFSKKLKLSQQLMDKYSISFDKDETITFRQMKVIFAQYFKKVNFKKLNKEKVSRLCRKLTEKIGDDEFKKKIDDRKVSKEEMINYCKDQRNIEKFSSGKEFEEYLETEEFREIDDFSEIRDGSSDQISEMCSCQVMQGQGANGSNNMGGPIRDDGGNVEEPGGGDANNQDNRENNQGDQ